MKLSISWVLALSASFTYAAVPISSVKGVNKLPVVPNKFIVEVASAVDIPTKRSPDAMPHEVVYSALKTRGIQYDVDKEYNVDGLFVGAAITLQNPQDVSALEDIVGVKAIRPVRKFEAPKPVKLHVVSGPNDPNIPADSESTHVITGVNKVHAEGNIGTGVKIGIIDTGIDYNHPALGGGFGPGFKVIGGYDFVGDDYDGSNTPVPDSDPWDGCAGHGTHVAGIIGADPGNAFNISGVAYGASLSAYRVFGCNGFVSDDVLVDALLRSFKDGQDIITLSIGGPDGWSESSSSVVASRIAAIGKIVTIAAGNAGSDGSWYTSSPGNGINVISVASSDNTVIALQNATIGGVTHDPITYFKTFPLPIKGALPIYATSNDTTIADDACNPLPDTTPDLSNMLVLIRRGSCTFVQKLTNAAAKGAKGILIYDNGNGFSSIDVGNFQAALIQAADGQFLVSQLAAGVPITISFPQEGASTSYPDPNGGLISSFSTYGPTNEFYFKPAVAAPGGNILSTLPVPLGSWAVESGTSMATPFVAGSAALLLSAKGKTPRVGLGARSLFQSTAQRISTSHTDGGPLQTLTQQGAGLIDVYAALHTTTLVSPVELVLNDTAHFHNPQTFTVTNNARKAQNYKLSHVPAGTALTVSPGTIFPATGPVPLSSDAVSITISPSSFALSPGQSKQVTASFKLPENDATIFPVYSGFIDIQGSVDHVQAAYLGLGASLKDKQVLDNTDYYFGVPIPAVLDSAGDVQEVATNYTFGGDDYPTLIARLVFGTPVFRMDLVQADISFNGTLNTRAIQPGPMFSFPHPSKPGTFAQVKIVGPLVEFDYLTRNNEAPDNGFLSLALNPPTFANGTAIPNGTYRALFRALKVTGDPTKEEDYESWLSPIVGINTP